MRAVFAVAAAIVLTAAGQAPVPAAAPHLVSIDVIASDDHGRRVDTLTPADFELREDGSVQALATARFVRDGARLLAIYLDEYHITPGANADRVREALARLIDDDLGPDDLVAVMKPLDSLFAIRLTRDRAALRGLVDAFDPRRGDYEPRNAYERNYIAGTPARIEAARTQVAWSAINALAVHLGSLSDRRKTLLVVTEGIERSERRRGLENLPTFDTVIRSANRSNVAIYSLDPRDQSLDDGDSELLRRLAGETDGQAIAADLDGGLRGAVADSSAYYLLTYPSAHPEDGRFHEVQVRVKRPGVTVRARRGYFSPSPDEAMRTALLARLNAPKPPAPSEPAPHASTLIRPWFGLSRGDAGRTRVMFVWEPAPRVPGDRTRRTASRLVLTARASDGTTLFEGPVVPTGPATIDEPGAASARALFDAPPGRLRVQMSIQDAAAQLLDRDVRDITVRDLRGQVALGTPQVLRARNAREFRSLDAAQAVPVVSREFSRSERLLIRVPVYGPAGQRLSVSARLISRMGQVMRDLAATTSPGAEDLHDIDLPLAGLAAGEYSLEVTATTAAGEAKDRFSFRVTG
jgi:VWFA-related protein